MEFNLEVHALENCRKENDYFIFAESDAQILYDVSGGILKNYEYIVFDIVNKEDYSVCINTKFWESELDKPCGLFIATGILPKADTTICLPISYLSGGTLFGGRYPGVLKTVVKGNKQNLDALHKMAVGLPPMGKETSLAIKNVRLTHEEVHARLNTEELIDEMGQYKNKEWPGKMQSVDECTQSMIKSLEEARNFLNDHVDGFYGDNSKKYDSTGFFRIEKEGERFWLITPDGQRFFSNGIDCVRSEIMSSCGDDNKQKDFLKVNLQRAFGDDWYESWLDITRYRMINWNANTVAAWSDLRFAKDAKIPYVKFLRGFPKTKACIYRDFPDVYSPEYEVNAKEYAGQLSEDNDDPYMIGYFMSNEPHWAFVDKLNLGYELVRNKDFLYTKKHLTAFMRERYGDDICNLNQSWESAFQSFDELCYLGEFPILNDTAMKDLEEFSKVMVKEYIRIPAEALKTVDFVHLNLGIRYAYISSDVLYSGSEYFDIFSINCYENTCDSSVIKVFEKVHKPIMIGEYHFGAIDLGLPATGIRGAVSCKERGRAIRKYIEHAAALNCCVGVHYFQWNDQGFLGRFDGENYNIGLVDICNNAYDLVVEQFKLANGRIYAIADGDEKPFDEEICYMPAIFY